MIRTVQGALLLLLAGLSPLAIASELTGLWKIDGQPVWIEVTSEAGVSQGIVRRNDVNPDATGRMLLKDIVADESEAGRWSGQVFAVRLGEFRDAQIALPEADQMEVTVKVGFMSRSIIWERVTELP